MGRILRQALLAPDLVEAIVGGWADQRVMLERLQRPLPLGWREQRHAWDLSLAAPTGGSWVGLLQRCLEQVFAR